MPYYKGNNQQNILLKLHQIIALLQLQLVLLVVSQGYDILAYQ